MPSRPSPKKSAARKTTRAKDLRAQVNQLGRKAATLPDAALRAQVDRLVDEIEAQRATLAEQRDELEALLQKRRGAVEAPAAAATRRSPGPRAASRDATEASASPSAERVERSFAGFLAEVGAAFSQAQASLDRESAAYLASGSSPFPTVFRLPRLNAEMKFALEKEGARGINLVFYSSKGSERELNQQSIEFELVAAPPPPGFAAPASPEMLLGPAWELIARPAEREALLREENIAPLRQALRLDATAFGAARDRLLLWKARLPAGAAAAEDEILLAAHVAEQGSAASLVVARWRRSGDGDARRIEDAQRILDETHAPALFNSVRVFLAAAATWQAALAPERPKDV